MHSWQVLDEVQYVLLLIFIQLFTLTNHVRTSAVIYVQVRHIYCSFFLYNICVQQWLLGKMPLAQLPGLIQEVPGSGYYISCFGTVTLPGSWVWGQGWPALLDYGILTLMAQISGHLAVVVNKNGRESEFKSLDPDGVPKNVSLLLSDGTPYFCTTYGPSSRVITPIARRTRSRSDT